MTESLAIVGGAAYSTFRKAAIASQLGIEAHEIEAYYVHYVSFKPHADNFDVELLQKLLTYGEQLDRSLSTLDPSVKDFFVVPRTLSPWSTKATNIAHICGFSEAVSRIERIVKVTILTLKDVPECLASELLHDRMTQHLLRSWPDPQEIFAEVVPTPASTIDITSEGVGPKDALQAANKTMGLALDESEINYLADAYSPSGSVPRDPYDVELFMFAQVSSSAYLIL